MNADKMENKNGQITHYVSTRLDVNGHAEMRYFLVLDLSCDVFIGFDWILDHNPEIDWDTEKIEFTHCHPGCHDSVNMPPIQFHQLYLCGVSMDITITDNAKKKAKSVDDLPKWLKDYADVFTPKPSDKLPPFWGPGLDHKINLKPDAPLVSPT
jgi:hypothetical protein